jgi:hypothetical protein
VSPDDHARELVAHVTDYMVQAGRREGIPLGFTWGVLLRGSREDFDQPALERANGQAMEGILEGIEDAEHFTVEGYLVVRVLDENGRVTEAGRVTAEVMAALEDYPVIDEEILSEIEQLGVEFEMEDTEGELERGYLWVWDGKTNVQLDLGDGLSKEQLGEMWERYSNQETETPYDPRGYGGINRLLVAGILFDLGLVEEPAKKPDWLRRLGY